MSAEDINTVKHWMVEGNSILNGKVKGTIPDKQTQPDGNIPGGVGYYHPSGSAIIPFPGSGFYHMPGQTGAHEIGGLYTVQPDIKPENIRLGKNIFGVKGTLAPSIVVNSTIWNPASDQSPVPVFYGDVTGYRWNSDEARIVFTLKYPFKGYAFGGGNWGQSFGGKVPPLGYLELPAGYQLSYRTGYGASCYYCLCAF